MQIVYITPRYTITCYVSSLIKNLRITGYNIKSLHIVSICNCYIKLPNQIQKKNSPCDSI